MAESFCGTAEYLSPEMVSHTAYDLTVDWWALGILIYEMSVGVTPFFNNNRQKLNEKIQNSNIAWPDQKKYKIDYSSDLLDIV